MAKYKIETYPLTVAYDLTIKQLVKAGKYDWSHSDITDEHYPSNQTGLVQMELNIVNFTYRFDSGLQVISELASLNHPLLPVSPKPLLTLGAAFPELQRQYLIVALGQTWRNPSGLLHVPDLYGGGSGRNLDLSWFEHDWFPDWRFAAVSNQSL